MKTQWLIPVIFGAAVCLTGCGRDNELTVQEDAVPVVTVETTAAVQTDHTDGTTDTTPAKTGTHPAVTVLQTGTGKPETASVTSQAAADAAVTKAAETAAPQKPGGSGSSGSAVSPERLSGKWETVSFSKDSGARVPYDLSDPVHRSYYVGLDLNEAGQSALTVGTVSQPASTVLHGSILTVTGISRDNPLSMDLTVSADRKSMTAELMNGRIIATLKRISSDFSLRPYKEQASDADFSAIAGDWSYQEEDPAIESVFGTVGFVTVRPDGTYTYQPADGAPRRSGTIRTESVEYGEGEIFSYFAFYEDDGNTPWVSTTDVFPNGRGCFDLGNGGMMRLFPWDLQGNQFDRFVGQWQSGSFRIQIGNEDDRFTVRCKQTTGASEYNEWTYLCEGDPANTALKCTGGGTLVRVTAAPDDTETRTEVYNDGTAGFTMNGSSLFWTDNKENAAQPMEFSMPD